MIKHVTITITGKVQKKGFRFATLTEALELGLTGFVEHKDKDKVYIEVEGEVENIKDLLRWAHRGPKGVKINNVDYTSSEELENFEEFICKI